ncbi:hypothetical protein NECAME_16923 [Necator americanus]|uniref:Peptidase A2 domain-containing protein n=1 Tax=Necator americanus TaxID=51031 RepID=W2TTW0_NECAM|nr:hypothetical protein NECAME_16923 [Necator americanus]ETN85084.1 hypothetical protein NECAME_16923 [Necator americanus]
MVASEGQPAAEQRNESQSLIISSNLAKEDSHQKQLVLLRSHQKQVKNNKTGAYENVLLFLDSGAQCNLIEATLADKFALVHSEPYQCTMYGIGGIEETYIAQKVTAEFRTRFGESVSLTLSTKPVLTKAFPSAALTCSDVQFLKRNNIFFSNTATNGELVKPHILILVEAYENIVMLDSPPTKLPSSLLAQNTVFGPALFGTSDTVGQTLLAEHVVVACPETLADVKQELRQMYELEDNIYVDNVFLNASTIQEALAKIESSRALFANIGMNLREFSSNSAEVHKLYNPLGLVAPLSLRARMLTRDAVMLKAGWNKPLDPEFLHEWNELCLDISSHRHDPTQYW